MMIICSICSFTNMNISRGRRGSEEGFPVELLGQLRLSEQLLDHDLEGCWRHLRRGREAVGLEILFSSHLAPLKKRL